MEEKGRRRSSSSSSSPDRRGLGLEEKLDAILSAHRLQSSLEQKKGAYEATEESLSLRIGKAIASAGSLVWGALRRLGVVSAPKNVDGDGGAAKDGRIPAIILRPEEENGSDFTLGVIGGGNYDRGGEEATVTEAEAFDLLLEGSGTSSVVFVIPEMMSVDWLPEVRGMQALCAEAFGPEAPVVVAVVWARGSEDGEEQRQDDHGRNHGHKQSQRRKQKGRGSASLNPARGAEALAMALNRAIGSVSSERLCFAFAHGRSTEALLAAARTASPLPNLARVFLSAGTARSAGFECPWPATIFSSASDANELIIGGGCIGQEPVIFAPGSLHRQVWVCATSSLALTVREPLWVGAHEYMFREGMVLAVGVEMILIARSLGTPSPSLTTEVASCPPRSVSELTDFLSTGMAGPAVDALLQLCSFSPHLTSFVASRAEQEGGRLLVRLRTITDKNLGPKAHAIIERLRPYTAMTLPIIRNAIF